MVQGSYSFKIKPQSAREGDYEMREYSNVVDEVEVEFPEGTTTRNKALILNYMAAESVLFFAVADNAIHTDSARDHVRSLRVNLRELLPQNLHPFITNT